MHQKKNEVQNMKFTLNKNKKIIKSNEIKANKTAKLHKKRNFPLKTSLVNVTKFTGNRRFGNIY